LISSIQIVNDCLIKSQSFNIKMSQNPVIEVIRKLQDPMPQYVLGLIPVIVTLGTAPFNHLKYKLTYVFRCLGAPYTGLFFT